ncbi:G-protein coupled bile acid receptor 1 isoform X2 [Hemicordylus capensis]|nr:G-protein coupled bile acid receptor 1 isoform X2 [Hemicordylus capensis]XP_053108647.1 G-protein coupled bile acid receptor 1 isoform X2 [Hemicordylus capensis]
MNMSSADVSKEDIRTQEHIILWLAWPLAVFIVLANIFIILGILFNRKLHGSTTWFFLSLLVADLLAGLVLPSVPQLLLLKKNWAYHACFTSSVAPNFIFLSFLANLLLMHYAKYVCIIYPLHYHNFWVHRWAALYIFLAWTAPLVFACLPMALSELKPDGNCSLQLVFPTSYLYVETYGLLIPAIFAMAFMCTRVLIVARRQLRNIRKLLHSVNQSQAPSELQQQLELRNAKGIASVSLIFLVCWVPYIACLNVSVLAISQNISPSPLFLTIVTCLGTGPAAAVPIILSLSNHQYTQFWRDKVTKVCGGCCQGQGCKQQQQQTSLPNTDLFTPEEDLNVELG